MTYKEEFITFMVRSGVLTFGDFTTKMCIRDRERTPAPLSPAGRR